MFAEFKVCFGFMSSSYSDTLGQNAHPPAGIWCKGRRAAGWHTVRHPPPPCPVRWPRDQLLLDNSQLQVTVPANGTGNGCR